MFKGKLLLEKMLESVEVGTATRLKARYNFKSGMDLVLSNGTIITLQMLRIHETTCLISKYNCDND